MDTPAVPEAKKSLSPEDFKQAVWNTVRGKGTDDDKALTRSLCHYITMLACITLGSMAVDGCSFLTPLETGSILIGGASLFYLIWCGFGVNKKENWKETTVWLLLVAAGIFAILGHVPLEAVSIPLTALGVLSYPLAFYFMHKMHKEAESMDQKVAAPDKKLIES